MTDTEIRWAMYTQNPEEVDEQGYYLKIEGEDPPWQTETDIEEFDGIFNPDKEGFSIRDLTSANKALAAHSTRGYVSKLIWW
ncbi:MAG: hypothetical protein KAT00_01370 [Planctomycetes bacterium]|nr:hypothetical protein [Planctomycetota bacterium]